MDLAVIMSVHNQNNARLWNCLRTFLYQDTSFSYGLYIVDYASTDNLRETLQQLNSDKVFYLHIDKEPLNRSHANNVALKLVDAENVCMVHPYCIAPMMTVDLICKNITPESLLLYVRHPFYVPEPIWQDTSITPEQLEAYRSQTQDWLASNLQIGPGPHKKRLFAINRQRILEINGYDEMLAYDEDVDIVRRLLQAGNVMVDLSNIIDIAYQPAKGDDEVRQAERPLETKDIHAAEASAAFRRKDPRRNLNAEWGVV